MTVISDINSKDVDGNGTTNPINFPYVVHERSDIFVYLLDENGVPGPERVEGVDYTVAIAADYTQADITPSAEFAAEADGVKIRITRTLPYDQRYNIVTNPRWDGREVMKALDRAAMRDQQLNTRMSRVEGISESLEQDAADAAAAADAAEAARDQVLAFEGLPIAVNVPFTPAGGITAENTQDAVEQVHGGLVAVANVLEGHIASLAAHSATAIEVSPVGGIESENVQDALAELDSEKSPVGHNHNGIYARKLASGTLAAVSELVIDLSAYVNFSRLELILEGWAPATDQVDLSLRFSTNGGSSWLTSNYTYNHAMCVPSSSNGWATGGSGAGALVISDAANATQRWGNAAGEEGDVRIELMGLANAASRPSALVHASYVAASGGIVSITGGGRHSAASAWNALRLFFSSGNILRGDWVLVGTP